jgi:hypothetical protein
MQATASVEQAFTFRQTTGNLSDNKKELYCLNRAAGYSMTESARRAGYESTAAPNIGHRFDKLPEVQSRIAELRQADQDIFESQGVTYLQPGSKHWITSQLIEIIELGIGRRHNFSRSKDPGDLPRVERDLGAANRALETLARLKGYMTESRSTLSTKVVAAGTVAEMRQIVAEATHQLPEAQRRELLAADPEVAELLSEPDTPASSAVAPDSQCR